MDGPSSSAAGAPSTRSEDNNRQKYVLPSDDEEDFGGGGATNGGEKKQKENQMVLSVDPDFVPDDDDECFADDDGPPPAPLSREIVDGAINRRSKDRQISPGVKMSIGNYDDVEEEAEETHEEQKIRFLESMRRIRQKQEEDFALDHPPPETDAMRQFIHKQVNNAMMFNQDNSSFQHIDYEPLAKRKAPKVVNGYLWGALIGNGSYGKVKEVIDVYTLTRRAAKIMKYDKLRKINNGWDNIRSEMSILRRLNHRNVVKLIEIFNLPSKGKVYMIFEYCIGSIQQIIDLEPAKRLTIGESHAIFVEMCHGLSYLHSKRISHKDIKPGNLLISVDMVVKICDFGVAEQIGFFQETGQCFKVNGTPKFQPPECVWGNHEFFDGYKADMWSAGVTLYNLVSGKYPFEQQILLKLYECIGNDPLVMPTNVQLSNELQDLITQLLDKDFTQRLDITRTLKHPWFVSSFPEDQGLGRMMERMRTGDRPLTMLPSLTAMFDGNDEELILDADGNEIVLPPPNLTQGGELDKQSFLGFHYLEARPGDGPPPPDGSNDDVIGVSEPVRRPSSRSAPTSAPPRDSSASAAPAPSAPEVHSAPESAADVTAAPEGVRRRRPKRNFFSCIFRSRTDSN